MKLLKASDSGVISGALRMHGVLPCGHTGFMRKIALREDLEPHFIKSEIKATVTKTDNFVALKHPEEQNETQKRF